MALQNSYNLLLQTNLSTYYSQNLFANWVLFIPTVSFTITTEDEEEIFNTLIPARLNESVTRVAVVA